MKFCEKCGVQLNDDTRFCPSCGSEVAVSSPAAEQNNTNQNDFSAKFASLNNTADTTADFDQNDIVQNKAMAILAYLGILVLIPIFAAKNSKFARFHSNQGLILLIVEVAWAIIYGILASIIIAISWRLYFLVRILGILSLVLLIPLVIGILNAANGKAKELPVIGKFRILK